MSGRIASNRLKVEPLAQASWFAKAFVGAVLCEDGCRVGMLSEEFGDGGFSVPKECVVICSKVHAILSDLHLNHSDAESFALAPSLVLINC